MAIEGTSPIDRENWNLEGRMMEPHVRTELSVPKEACYILEV
jgi:hypothetical protein